MLEYLALVAFGGLSSLCGGLVTYAILRKVTSDDAILDKIDLITDEVMKNEEMQKKVYSIGALIGSGIASGAGLQKKGGKFSLQDLVMQVAGQWIQGHIKQGPARAQDEPLPDLRI